MKKIYEKSSQKNTLTSHKLASKSHLKIAPVYPHQKSACQNATDGFTAGGKVGEYQTNNAHMQIPPVLQQRGTHIISPASGGGPSPPYGGISFVAAVPGHAEIPLAAAFSVCIFTVPRDTGHLNAIYTHACTWRAIISSVERRGCRIQPARTRRPNAVWVRLSTEKSDPASRPSA